MPWITDLKSRNGLWGILRYLFDKSFIRPGLDKDWYPLPAFLSQIYDTVTPTGIPCRFRVVADLFWAEALERGCLVDLSVAERDAALAAWEREVLWPVINEGFIGLHVQHFPELDFPVTKLRFWRVSNEGGENRLHVDLNGTETVRKLNARVRQDNWHHQSVSVRVYSLKAEQLSTEQLRGTLLAK